MINIFQLKNGRLNQVQVEERQDLEGTRPIWVDIIEPDEEEKRWAREAFHLDLPDSDEMTDLEASARFYETENGEIHIHSDFILDQDEDSRNVPVAFILKNNILFSLHAEDLPVFRLLRMRARFKPGYVENHLDVLMDLYSTDAEYSADALESVYAELEKVSAQVLKKQLSDEDAASVLAAIAQEEDLNGRIRRNVMDTRRALSFLMRSRLLNPEQFEDARQILRDLESLDNHTSFLFDKINFLMDATVGFININQNKIIKIFSVASVAFLPPTLIASIYGMNFEFLPELKMTWGYPVSLLLMLASAVTPFLYFRKRGWLK